MWVINQPVRVSGLVVVNHARRKLARHGIKVRNEKHVRRVRDC